MGLAIDLYCNDGSPLGIVPPDIYSRGVGGAELSMMTWAETMAARGHWVRVYNNPPRPDTYGGVTYYPQSAFRPGDDRDVFVAYRSPNRYVQTAKARTKIHWSTDQYTVGNFATDVFPHVDRVVCISPYHVAYHRQRYGVEDGKVGYFDLGVRLGDYAGGVEKIPGRCIFCSVPDRGLDILRVVWPLIKEQAPHASLVITSDYTLWGAPPLDHQHRLAFLGQPDVIYLGKVGRTDLAREQQAAEVMSYPCRYEELFCISAAECQACGVVPVTTDFGALATTNQWGTIILGNPLELGWQREFAAAVASLLNDGRRLEKMAKKAQAGARARFDWERICNAWEHLIETGEFA